MHWIDGRQGTGYQKTQLAKGKYWDLYLIRYKPGAYIGKHYDYVPMKRHWRVNLRILGEDTFRGEAKLRLGRLIVFRPDIQRHEVVPSSRLRLVLSFGFVTG